MLLVSLIWIKHDLLGHFQEVVMDLNHYFQKFCGLAEKSESFEPCFLKILFSILGSGGHGVGEKLRTMQRSIWHSVGFFPLVENRHL